jgi:methylated-DNA-protein-cysteine methyltransferase-like protein
MTEFEESLYSVLASLPKGKVTSYGRLAELCGYPNYSRHVGKVLSKLPKNTKLPWFRVVNSQGKISLTGDAFFRQKQLLAKELIEVNDSGKIIKFKSHLY